MWSSLQSPLAMKLTVVLLHFGWQALLLLCVWRIGSALMPQKTAAVRYNGALATLCVMLLCPVLTFLVIDPWKLPAQDTASPAPTIAISADASSLTQQSVPGNALADTGNLPVPEEGNASAASLGDQANSNNSSSSATSLLVIYQPYLMLLWLGGVVLLGLRICLSYLGTVWLRNVGLIPVETDILIRFSQIARQLDVIHLPPIAFSNRISQAMTVGLMRPMVLLPVAWMTEISPEVLEAVLAHELAHVRRSDLWINFLQRVAETAFFYHPAVWILSAEIRRHRESCCDELAVEATGQRLDYARSLHEVAHWQFAHGSPSLAMGFLGQRRGELIARVRHILGVTPPQAGERSWPAGLILVVAPLAFWAASAIFFPEISPQVQAEEATQEEPAEEAAKPVVPPHYHPPGFPPPHPPGFPPPHFGPPPRDGRPPFDGRGPHVPPHWPPPRGPRPMDGGFAPPSDSLRDAEVSVDEQRVRRALRSMRQELRELRQQVEDLKQENDEEPSVRRHMPPREREAWPSEEPLDSVDDEGADDSEN